jgi:indolepyruvate ferredoxin oxidoreductase beta subunit
MIKEFNVVISGIGGQGVLTLSQVIANAAFLEGYDVMASELHGLAQRGGQTESHVRFGRKVFSPLVMSGKANLVFALEPLEALKACRYGSKENGTIFLIDNYPIPPSSVYVLNEKYPEQNEILKTLEKFGSKVIFVDATLETVKNFGSFLPSNIYLLSYAISKGFIPLSSKFVLKAMKTVLPEKFYELNEKVFKFVQAKSKEA